MFHTLFESPRSELLYEENFLSNHRELMELLINELPWEQGEVTLFGKTHKEPRLSVWVGDPDAVYTYSGRRLQPRPWTPTLQQIRKKLLEKELPLFNSCLANYYRNGDDSMGWHRDNEKELGKRPLIASVSLGATRKFSLRPHKSQVDNSPLMKSFERIHGHSLNIDLAGGSLLLMKGDLNKELEHCLRKTKNKEALRVNLTFRMISPQGRISGMPSQ